MRKMMRWICDVLETAAFCFSVVLGQDEPDTFHAWAEFWRKEEERACR